MALMRVRMAEAGAVMVAHASASQGLIGTYIPDIPDDEQQQINAAIRMSIMLATLSKWQDFMVNGDNNNDDENERMWKWLKEQTDVALKKMQEFLDKLYENHEWGDGPYPPSMN